MSAVIVAATSANVTTATGILPSDHGGTGAANNVASTLTISGNFPLTFTLTGATSITLPTSGSLGDMLKSTYDPGNAGYISGVSPVGGGAGGRLIMDGSAVLGGGAAGDVNTSGGNHAGGYIKTFSSDASGGYIDTSGGGASGTGGNIDTSGSTAGGGSISTSDGGGSINTKGTGFIEFGVLATRTTLSGTATVARAISLPDTNGTLALTSQLIQADSGWTANADSGSKTAVIPSSATIAGFVTALDLVASGLGAAFAATAEKSKAMESVLASYALPNV